MTSSVTVPDSLVVNLIGIFSSEFQRIRLIERMVQTHNAKMDQLEGELANKKNEVQAYAERLQELEAKGERYVDELRFGKAVLAMSKYPSELKDMDFGYDVLILSAVLNHVRAKGLDTKLTLREIVGGKSYLYSYSIFGVTELLECALGALKGSLPNTRNP